MRISRQGYEGRTDSIRDLRCGPRKRLWLSTALTAIASKATAVLSSMGEARHVSIPTVGRTKRMDASVGYLIAYLALLGCTRERTLRRLPGWLGTPAIEESSDDRDIGRLPATRRSAKSRTVSYSRVLACGRLQHYSATASEILPIFIDRGTPTYARARRNQLQVSVPALSFSVLLRCSFGCRRSRRAAPWWPPAHAGLEQSDRPSSLFDFQIVGTVELTQLSEQQRNELTANERRKLTP
jgi:hypothetical protein